jgi:hypothetical protein
LLIHVVETLYEEDFALSSKRTIQNWLPLALDSTIQAADIAKFAILVEFNAKNMSPQMC